MSDLDLSGISSYKLELKRKMGKDKPPDPDPEVNLELRWQDDVVFPIEADERVESFGFAAGNSLVVGDGLVISSGEGIRLGTFEPTSQELGELSAREFRAEPSVYFNDGREQSAPAPFGDVGGVGGWYREVETRTKLTRCYQACTRYCDYPTYSNYTVFRGHIASVLVELADLMDGSMMLAAVSRELGERGNTVEGATIMTNLARLVDDDNFNLDIARARMDIAGVVAMARACWSFIYAVRVGAGSPGFTVTIRMIDRYAQAKKVLDTLEERTPFLDADLEDASEEAEQWFRQLNASQVNRTGAGQVNLDEAARVSLDADTARIVQALDVTWFWDLIANAPWKNEAIEGVRQAMSQFGFTPSLRVDAYNDVALANRLEATISKISLAVSVLEDGQMIRDRLLIELAEAHTTLRLRKEQCPFGRQVCLNYSREVSDRQMQRIFRELAMDKELRVSDTARLRLCDAALEQRRPDAESALRYLLAATKRRVIIAFDAS